MLKLQQEPIYLDGPVGQLETLVIAPRTARRAASP